MSALMDLRIVAKQLKGVVLSVQELADNMTHNNCKSSHSVWSMLSCRDVVFGGEWQDDQGGGN